MINFFRYPRRCLAGIHPKKQKRIPDKRCRECQHMAKGEIVRRADLLLTLHESIIQRRAFFAERPPL